MTAPWKTAPGTAAAEETHTRRQPPYHVVLLDDDAHTVAYVVVMLRRLFGHPPETGLLLAQEVHETGRAVLLTTTREHAELKQEQVHAFGPDPYVRGCAGSMSCELEPAA